MSMKATASSCPLREHHMAQIVTTRTDAAYVRVVSGAVDLGGVTF